MRNCLLFTFFPLYHPLFLICTFSFLMILHPSRGCNLHGPPISSAVSVLLILPLSGCSDAVSLPQIYAFGISHRVASPPIPSSQAPLFSKFSTNLLFLRQHLHSPSRWDGYIYFVSVSGTHISTHVL